MKCSQCGAELEGKFCSKCGAPAPVVSEANNVPAATESTESQPYQPVNEPVGEVSAEDNQNQVQPVDYNPFNTQPSDVNTYAEQNQATPNATSFGQQFTNQPNENYSGQQFTNQQNNNPNGKKPMSGGKIAIIVVSIVLGLLIILGVIVGVVACNIVKSVKNNYGAISELIDDYESSYNYDDTYEESNDSSNYDDSYTESYDSDYSYLDEESHCHYAESDDGSGCVITGYDNDYDYTSSKITVNVPSSIDGRPVVAIEELAVFDNDDSDNGYIKIIIPGSVKVIKAYAFSFCDDINEVVIEDGVTTLEETSFKGCNDLEKVTIPKSVTEMDGCGLGFECDDDLEEHNMGNDFVMYCDKNSVAEQYAKTNHLNCVAK